MALAALGLLLAVAAGGLAGGCVKAKTAPVLVSVEPADGATGVDPGTVLRLVFDQPMSSSGAGAASVDPPLPGGWYAEGNALTYHPIEPLLNGATYRINLAEGAVSLDGVASKSSGTWTFTVRDAVVGHQPVIRTLEPIEAFPGVRALAFGPEGELYAASDADVQVRASGVTAFAPYSSGWTSIEDVDVDASGRVWLLLAEKDNYRAVRLATPGTGGGIGPEGAPFDLTVAIPQPEYPSDQWNWFYPKRLTLLPGGDLLILGTDRVVRLGQDGQVKAELGVGTLGGSCTEFYIGPAGMVLEGDTLYVENGKGSADTRGFVGLSLDGSKTKVYRFGVGGRGGLARDAWGDFYTVSRDPAEPLHLEVFGPEGDEIQGALSDSSANLDDQTEPGEMLIRDGVLYIAGGVEGEITRFSIE